jgi:molybdopterin-guanine dinucleotide biosynthesis protein A
MNVLTVVLLAGGPPDALSALQEGAPNKAFVEIAGVTLVERTIVGLRASSAVGRIIAVAPPIAHGRAALAGVDELRPDGVKIRESLRSGLRDLPPDELVLVSTSDLPVLTGAAVDDFVRRAISRDPDLGYGCLEKRTHLARFPEVPHTWARLRDGTYCGGGLFALKPRILGALDLFIEQLGAARKNPLKLAGLMGRDVMLRFATGRLSIEHAESRASALLGARVCALVSPFAETAVNVDRVSDIALAEKLVREGR